MSDKEKVFANGIIFKRNNNAPDFVVGKLSLKVDELIPFLEEHAKNGWVNLNINKGKSGKYYAELDTWEKKQDNNGDFETYPQKDDLPF